MTIYPEDKETLLSGTSLVRFKIEILKDGKIVKTLDENSIVNLDLEDFRYVDPDSLVVGQFVAKKVTGELDRVYNEFSIEDTEIALRMGVSYNNDDRFKTRNITSEGGNAVTCTDQTAIPTPTKPVPFKPLHGKIPLYVNWSGKDNDVTLDEIDLGDITLELFSIRNRIGGIKYFPDTIKYNHDAQQWWLTKRWASITGADILYAYNNTPSSAMSNFIKYDTDSKTIYIELASVVHHSWELSNYTNITYSNRVRSNYFPSAHYAETPDSEENIQGVDKALQDNNIYITIRYDSLFTDVDSFITWLKEHQDLEIKYFLGNQRLEITEEDYPELYKQLQQVLVSGTTYYYLGKYLVTKPTTDDVKSKTTFEALDYTKKFNKKFDPSGITFPCKACELADYCCKKCGVYLETDNFTNMDFEIKNNQYDSDATYRNVMQDIGKLAYSWVRINDNNDCVIDFYVPTEDDFNDFNKITGSNYYDLSRKEKAYGPVNRVVIGLSDIEGENVTVEDADSINKNGVCELKVMDNNLTYTPELRAKASEGAKRLFGLTYFPLEITTTGHPWLEGNDLIEITTPDGDTYQTIPFDRTLTYAGHIKTKIASKGDTALETAYKSTPSMESEIKRTRYIVDKDGQRITELVEKSTKQDQQISELTVSVDNIESKVRRTVDLTTDGTTEAASLNLARVNAGAPVEVIIHPIDEDISYLYPSKNLFPSDLTFLKIRNIQFTNTTTKETFTYTLPMDLWYLDKDTYDEFHLEYATSTCEIIQRVDWNNNQDKYKLDKEVIHTFDFPKIDLTSGDYTISLPGYDTGYIYAKLMVQNQITNQYATKAELNSKIEQAQSSITLEVNGKFENTQKAIDKKADSDTVNSELSKKANTSDVDDEFNTVNSNINNLQESDKTITGQLALKLDTKNLASEIDAVADKINLTGLTTVNKNFQILKDGSIVANNGSFTGNIYLNDGSRVIGGNGLLSVLDFYAQGPVGFDYADYDHIGMGSEKTRRLPLIIYYNIPDNFTITQAYAIVEITAVYTAYRTFKDSSKTNYADDWTDTTGVAKQLNLYKGTSQSTDFGYFPGGDAGVEYSCDLGTKIPYGFGTESYTPRLSTSGDSEIKTSVDLVSLGKKNNTDYLEKGFHTIGLATSMTPPVLEDRLVNKDMVENTSLAKIYLYVYGYMTLPQ